jgi:hypothetical protein
MRIENRKSMAALAMSVRVAPGANRHCGVFTFERNAEAGVLSRIAAVCDRRTFLQAAASQVTDSHIGVG